MPRKLSYDSECEFLARHCSDAEPASPTAPSVDTWFCGICNKPCGNCTGHHWLTEFSAAARGHRYVLVLCAPQPERVSPGSAPNTDAPRQNETGTASDNYFQQIHDSDDAWAERNGGQRDG